MKKLIFIVCAVLGICTFVGCGNKTAEGNDVDSVSTDSIVVVDSIA